MVSIIIPCYNGEKFIDRCFNSILNQTYKDIELILINDGSIDNSEKIILSYKKSELAKKGIKLKYLYKENGGAASAINQGLKIATGEYLMLLDIDDYLMENSVKFQAEFLDSHKDYDIVRTNGYYVTETNLENKDLFVVDEYEKNNIYIFDDLVQAKTNNWAGSYMVRSKKLLDFYKDKNIYKSKYGQNLQILMPVAYNGKSGFIDIPLVKYIRQENSVSQVGGDINKEISNLLGYKDIRQYMINSIILDNNEKDEYIKSIEIKYARYFMDLGLNANKKEVVYENYNKLKRLNSNSLDDKILYYGLKNKPVQYVLRLYRKLFIRR